MRNEAFKKTATPPIRILVFILFFRHRHGVIEAKNQFGLFLRPLQILCILIGTIDPNFFPHNCYLYAYN